MSDVNAGEVVDPSVSADMFGVELMQRIEQWKRDKGMVRGSRLAHCAELGALAAKTALDVLAPAVPQLRVADAVANVVGGMIGSLDLGQ